jgi:undecaprenyl-diphosphatase
MIAALGLWLLIEVVDRVREGTTLSLDRRLLLALRAEDGGLLGPPWLQEAMRDFTGLGGNGVLTLVTLGVAGFLWLEGRPRAALLLVLATVGGVLIGSGLKIGFARPRPDLAPHGSVVYTKSFPSGHSTMSAVVYLLCGMLVASTRRRRRVGAYVIGLGVAVALTVGVTRVYLGVHWPSDVLAGLALGSAWALFCWGGVRLLVATGRIRADASGPS